MIYTPNTYEVTSSSLQYELYEDRSVTNCHLIEALVNCEQMIGNDMTWNKY